MFPKERSLSDVVGKSIRQSFHLLVGATLATGLPIVGALVTASLDRGPRWLPLLWVERRAEEVSDAYESNLVLRACYELG